MLHKFVALLNYLMISVDFFSFQNEEAEDTFGKKKLQVKCLLEDQREWNKRQQDTAKPALSDHWFKRPPAFSD